MPPVKIVARLTCERRAVLERYLRTGTHPARLRVRSQILLLVDADGPDAWPNEQVAEHLGTSRVTVQRVRQQFAAEGLDATPHRKRPAGRQYRKLDGPQEARLVQLARSEPPAGRVRWTMRLLADRLVELEVVAPIDPATVCRTLRKTNSSRGPRRSGSSRRRRAARS